MSYADHVSAVIIKDALRGTALQWFVVEYSSGEMRKSSLGNLPGDITRRQGEIRVASASVYTVSKTKPLYNI